MEMKPDKEGGSHAVPLSWHTHCVPAASRHFCCPAPRCLPHSGTPLGHTLRGTASPAVPDASGQLLIFFFSCSASKIRWLVALFSHAEELTLSHILPCPPLTHNCAQAKHCPCCPGPLGCCCSPTGDGELWEPPDGGHGQEGCTRTPGGVSA